MIQRVMICLLGLLMAASGARAGVNLNAPAVFPAPVPTAPPYAPLYPYVQAFCTNIPDASVLVNNASFIWSADSQSGGCGAFGGGPPPIPGLNRTYYWPLASNNANENPTANLAWFQNNHPDWIMYKSDMATPAYLGSKGFSSAVVNGSAVITVSPSVNFPQIAVGNPVFGVGLPTAGSNILQVNTTNNTVKVADNYTGSTGTATLYYGGNTASIPFNFQDPNARAYMLGFLDTAIDSGNFQGIAIDLASAVNSYGAAGFYAGATPGGGALPASGGTWVQLYSGNSVDNQFFEASAKWACTITDNIHAQRTGAYTAGNVANSFFSYDFQTPDYVALSALTRQQKCFDTAVNESGFYECKQLPIPCKYLNDQAFALAIDAVHKQAKIGGWWLIEYPPCSVKSTCYGVDTVTTGAAGSGYTVGCNITLTTGAVVQVNTLSGSGVSIAVPASGSSSQTFGALAQAVSDCGGIGASFTLTYRPDEAYATAIWLLTRSVPGTGPPNYWAPVGGFTGVAGSPSDRGTFAPPSGTWTPAIGIPITDPYINAGGCWQRDYTKGSAVLNASSTTSCNYNAPANAFDQFGAPVPVGTNTLPVHWAINLVTS